MNQQMTSKSVTPGMVEELLGIAAGSFGAIGWLVIQEQAHGASVADIALELGTDESSVLALIESIVGPGEEGLQKWAEGITALKMARRLNEHAIAMSWDAVEAMAIEKVAAGLSEMKTNGDPLKMLAIAEKANRAIRRNLGERSMGESKKPGVNAGDASVLVTLPAGHQGQIMMNLSPHVQKQLSDPNRVVGDGPKFGGTRALEMIRLEDTRRLAEGESGLDSGADLNGNEAQGNAFAGLRELFMGDESDGGE